MFPHQENFYSGRLTWPCCLKLAIRKTIATKNQLLKTSNNLLRLCRTFSTCSDFLCTTLQGFQSGLLVVWVMTRQRAMVFWQPRNLAQRLIYEKSYCHFYSCATIQWRKLSIVNDCLECAAKRDYRKKVRRCSRAGRVLKSSFNLISYLGYFYFLQPSCLDFRTSKLTVQRPQIKTSHLKSIHWWSCFSRGS